MKKNQVNIDKIIQEVLNEEIDLKISLVMEMLKGNQDKLDVAEPKGKLTKADFEKLRSSKKKETKEGGSVCEQCGGEMSEGQCNECGYGRMEEDWDEEMEEGNAFSGALAIAKKHGDDEFTVDGKTYPVKEEKEKWIQKTKMKKGALHKSLGIPEDEKIPTSKLKSIKKDLHKKSEGDKKLSSKDSKKMKQVNMALNLRNLKENNMLSLTETELVDLIESIVLQEQNKNKLDVKVKDITEKIKSNIGKKYVSGLSKTEKAQSASKKENEDYVSSVTKKMKEYMKDMGDSDFEMNPKSFPKGNGQVKKDDRVGYVSTDAADEYIQNFTAAGLENITYDEIHPDEEWVDDAVEGSSRTGNNPEWANAVDTGVNKKRNQVRKDNLLGAVKQMAYNKAPQPVVDDMKSGAVGKFERNFGKGSGKKASKILTQLESKESKSVLNEEKKVIKELEKIKNLYSYNKKTQ